MMSSFVRCIILIPEWCGIVFRLHMIYAYTDLVNCAQKGSMMALTNASALPHTCSKWGEYLLALSNNTPKYFTVLLVYISVPPISILNIFDTHFPVNNIISIFSWARWSPVSAHHSVTTFMVSRTLSPMFCSFLIAMPRYCN
jgi:hypothetical protein